MNILYVNTKFHGGGAEKVARQLYTKMAEIEDIKVFYLAGRPSGETEGVHVVYGENAILKIYNFVKRVFTNNARKQDFLFRKKIISMIKENHIDIIHLHNIHGNYMGIMDLMEIRKYCKIIIWTLHDMWAMTGHCAYPVQCDKWIKDGCKSCLNLKLYPKLRIDIAAYIYRTKKRVLVNQEIFFVIPSEWLMGQFERSFLAKENRRLIYNGVDTTLFYPMNKERLRKQYRISQDKIVLMFISNNLWNPYKGIETLGNALKMVKRKEDYELLVVGEGKHMSFDENFVCHYMGYVSDDEKMNELYNLSDVFILPSSAENFPCSVLESMSAGTPVIASKVGGIVEQIDSETGWLFDAGDVKQLAYIINGLFFEKNKLTTMSVNCRKRVGNYFSEKQMIQSHKTLYEELVARV